MFMSSGINRLLACAAMALSLGGCIVYNTEPLSPPNEAKIDESLLGAWQSVEKGATDKQQEHLDLDITRKSEHEVLIAVTSYETDGSNRQHVYLAHSSVHGALRYLNAYSSESDRQLRGYMTVRYAINDKGELRVALIDEAAARKAIQSGGLEGMVNVTSEFADPTITAAEAPFADYLRDHDAEMFLKVNKFVRRSTQPAAKTEKPTPATSP
jgi:hypothetical protein